MRVPFTFFPSCCSSGNPFHGANLYFVLFHLLMGLLHSFLFFFFFFVYYYIHIVWSSKFGSRVTLLLFDDRTTIQYACQWMLVRSMQFIDHGREIFHHTEEEDGHLLFFILTTIGSACSHTWEFFFLSIAFS